MGEDGSLPRFPAQGADRRCQPWGAKIDAREADDYLQPISVSMQKHPVPSRPHSAHQASWHLLAIQANSCGHRAFCKLALSQVSVHPLN